MDCVLLVCGFIMATFLHTAVGACTIEDRTSSCNYTIVCEIYANPINVPSCSYRQNVTFEFTKSTATVLNLGLFSATNFDSKVRNIIFKDNTWETIEYKGLKYYKASTYVQITHNNIKHIEDGSFTDFIYMKHLNLSHNKIEDLYNRSLHFSTAVNELQILDLSYNSLTSLNSFMFQDCSQLRELYLQNNQISTLSENTFEHLKHLKTLKMNNNNICSINMTLAFLAELNSLDISYNCLLKLHGFEFIRLVSLVKLRISNNRIRSIDHATFKQSPGLLILDLGSNIINGTLEEDIFINNHRLAALNLYGNLLRAIPPKFFQHSNLQYLNLEENSISGELTSDVLKGIRMISSFNLTHQYIKAIRNNSFSQMTKLKYMNLSNNCINTIENASFVNASALEILDISHNKIGSLNFFKMFSSNLSNLFLSNNNIVTIPENVFKGHSNLKLLDISQNSIAHIDQSALPLNKLEYLGINHNDLNGIVVDNIFSPAKLLRNLDLSNFRLNRLNDSALIDLPLVARVNLSHNYLDSIHPSNFKGVDNMFSLDISYNNLTYLVLDTKLHNLKAIYLNNNKLNRLPDIFGIGSKLEYLDISHNNISNIIDPSIENLNKIKVLNLSYNNLTGFNNVYTNSIQNLTYLILSFNKIEKMVDISFYARLENLVLNNNVITYIDSSQLKNAYSLKGLFLSGNRIKILGPGTFQHLSSLLVLDLSSNNLTNVRFGTFRGLNNIIEINLSRNALNELNFEIFHECYELKSLFIDYNNISSVDITKIIKATPKLEVLSLGGNPIRCEEIIRSQRIAQSEMKTNISVTSIHKIFHEDNVNGIKCGNEPNEPVETITAKTIDSEKSDGISTVLTVWCAVLSVVFIMAFAAYYVRQRNKKRMNVKSESRMQFQNTTNSECYTDLLI